MSYILEALKKAQAERQIGSTPTIHAPTLASVPAGRGARARRAPAIVAMVLMASAIAGLAAMLVRQQSAASHQPTVAGHTVPSAAPVAAGAVPASPPAAAAPPAGQPLTPVVPAPQPESSTRAEAPRTAVPDVVAPAKQEHAVANPAKANAPQLAAAPQAGSGTAEAKESAAAPAAPPPAPAEEYVQSLHELPEPIQRAIPQIAFGGYMYSKNPADRLLVIDKVLRKEGEEVAPGLVLVKLQPKQAIFGFRGYRYRVPL
jgi:general secretion pathway protein B